jgi:hypothetical protein
MSRIMTFEDYVPLARGDEVPWTIANIEVSENGADGWSLIDSIGLLPYDEDPMDPKPRTLTTSEASDIRGLWYRVVFLDDQGFYQAPTEPIQDVDQTTQNYWPTVRQVAQRITSRTRMQFGDLAGTFNDQTTPTATQVEGVIAETITEVADTIGNVVPAQLIDDASAVAALKAAMQVELSFFSDQVNTGRSIYPQLEKQYTAALASLATSIRQAESVGGDGAVIDTSPSRRASMGGFPEPQSTWGQKF